MKRIVLFISCFLVFCFMFNEVLYCQDIYYTNRNETLYKDYSPSYGKIADINENEIINIIGKSINSDTKGVKRIEVQIENGISGWLAINAISVKDSISLPEEITDYNWIHSYYLDVLRKGMKEAVFEYEPFWRDNFNKYKDLLTHNFSWNTFIEVNYIQFNNIFIRIEEIRSNFYNIINGRIYKVNNSYQFYSNCIKKLVNFDECIYGNYFNINEKVKVTLEMDGDYLLVFINDKKLFTLIKQTEEIVKQFNNLMLDNYVDLSEIVWPRRAYGSMDYPPPSEDLSRTNDEIISDNKIADNIASHENFIAQDNGEKNSLPLPLLLAIIGGAVVIAGVVVVVLRKKK